MVLDSTSQEKPLTIDFIHAYFEYIGDQFYIVEEMHLKIIEVYFHKSLPQKYKGDRIRPSFETRKEKLF